MFVKPRKASTDPRVRSLLQKAARRGFTDIVDRAIDYLHIKKDNTWLRSRTVVITFEECWPLAGSLNVDREVGTKRCALIRVARSVKQKDAAGLGALAHAFQEGDRSMLDYVPDKEALRIVAEATQRPKEFFAWVARESTSKRTSGVAENAERYLAAATWVWDKACILAGAFLSLGSESPDVRDSQIALDAFPYWAALDKHTDEGKGVIRAVAKRLNISYRKLVWTSFYCESTVVNELLPSPWFEAERTWRLRRAGVSYEESLLIWKRARPMVEQGLEFEATKLERIVGDIQPMPAQQGLGFP